MMLRDAPGSSFAARPRPREFPEVDDDDDDDDDAERDEVFFALRGRVLIVEGSGDFAF